MCTHNGQASKQVCYSLPSSCSRNIIVADATLLLYASAAAGSVCHEAQEKRREEKGCSAQTETVRRELMPCLSFKVCLYMCDESSESDEEEFVMCQWS